MSTQVETMSVQEVADKLVDLCREGKHNDAINELYDDNAVNIEPQGSPAQTIEGKEAILSHNSLRLPRSYLPPLFPEENEIELLGIGCINLQSLFDIQLQTQMIHKEKLIFVVTYNKDCIISLALFCLDF